jgi:hypothetical protein
MKKIEASDIKNWMRDGVAMGESYEDACFNVLAQLANGYYSAVTMREELEDYYDKNK